MRRMWQVWPGRGWPADAQAEASFVAELQRRVERPGRASRDDVTALMTILRCGSTLDDALRFAPGLRLAGLLAAHVRLDRLRVASLAAWSRVTASPTLEIWRDESAAVARLFPVVADRVAAALAVPSSPRLAQRLAAQVEEINVRMNEVSATVREIERRCASTPPELPQSLALASLLYNPRGGSAYVDPFFVPDRVAVLSPARVGDLLGEQRQ